LTVPTSSGALRTRFGPHKGPELEVGGAPSEQLEIGIGVVGYMVHVLWIFLLVRF
jgi:hypothetical protein